jgi:hypothetical protein
MDNNIFEELIQQILRDEIAHSLETVMNHQVAKPKQYMTIREVADKTGIGAYTIRQLTFSRAMPHRKVKARIIFDYDEIEQTIHTFRMNGWNDPENQWDIKVVQEQIRKFEKTKENPMVIEEIIRKIFKDELSSFTDEIHKLTKGEKEKYYGRTVLTIKEASTHFRTSPATIYNLIKEDGMPHLRIQSRYYIVLEEAEAFLWRETAKSYADSGNIYWQRILQRLDWEEKERNSAYEKALNRLEERF